MECKTWKTIDVKGERELIMGEGIHFHIRDELWDGAAMRVHMERYHPVGPHVRRPLLPDRRPNGVPAGSRRGWSVGSSCPTV